MIFPDPLKWLVVSVWPIIHFLENIVTAQEDYYKANITSYILDDLTTFVCIVSQTDQHEEMKMFRYADITSHAFYLLRTNPTYPSMSY